MNRNPSRGFTLVEMLIVIAILGIVLGIAAPNFTRYRDNANLKEAARDISSDIQLYKQRAIAENTNYEITFSGNTYDVNKGATPVVRGKRIGANNAAIVISSPYPGGKIELETRGTLKPSGELRLKHSRRGSEATITTSLTGRVRVTYAY
jgi:prepilin-type N-terminal cleavage/methylation domain-containing protein